MTPQSYSRHEKEKKKDNRRRVINSPAWPNNNDQVLDLPSPPKKRTNSHLSRRKEFNKRQTNNNDLNCGDIGTALDDELKFENKLNQKKTRVKHGLDREKVSNQISRISVGGQSRAGSSFCQKNSYEKDTNLKVNSPTRSKIMISQDTLGVGHTNSNEIKLGTAHKIHSEKLKQGYFTKPVSSTPALHSKTLMVTPFSKPIDDEGKRQTTFSN